MRVKYLIILFCLFSCQAVFGGDKLFEKWRWRIFTPKNGLPDRNFSIIMQARNTLYYAASGKRAFLYDGYKWQELEFLLNRKPHEDIRQLVEGREGLIFASTSKGVWAFQLGSGFQKIHEGRNILLTASPEREVFFLDEGRLYRMIGTQVHMLQNVDPVKREKIYSLAVDDTEIIWVATDQGLLRQERYGWSYDPELQELGLGKSSCRNLFVAGGLNLWADFNTHGNKWALIRRKAGHWQLPCSDSPDSLVLSLSGYADGVTYAFTEKGGLYRFKNGEKNWERFARIRPGSPVTVSSIVDNRQALWMCFRSIGIARFNARSDRWQRISLGISFPRDRVLSILCSKDGTTWVGTQNGLFASVGGKEKSFPDLMGNKLERITGLAEDKDGGIWVVSPTAFSGAFIFSKGRWSRQCLPFPNEDVHFFKVFIDAANRKWLIASESDETGGAWLLNGNVPQHYSRDEGLLGNKVYDVCVTSDNKIWFATNKGLSRLNSVEGLSSWYHLTAQDGNLASNHVWDLEEGKDGSIWIVYRTGGGVSRWKAGKLTHYGNNNGLANENVWSVKVSKNGDVWFGTQTGLSRFDGTAFYNYEVGEDQLLSNVWPIAVARDQRGIIVGTLASGVFMFKRNDNDPPRVFPLQNPKQFSYNQAVRLSWEGLDRFNQTHYEDLLYILKLDGKQWTTPQVENNFVDKNLSHGKHVLEVQVRDQDGNQAPFPLKIKFYVALSWFQRPTTFLGVGLAVLFLLILIIVGNNWRRQAKSRFLVLKRIAESLDKSLIIADSGGVITNFFGTYIQGLEEGCRLQETELGRKLLAFDQKGRGALRFDNSQWNIASFSEGIPRGWILEQVEHDIEKRPPSKILEQAEALANSSVFELAECKVFSAVEAVRELLQELKEEDAARVKVTIPLPEIVWKAVGYKGDFKKILKNLLDNALENLDADTITIFVQNKRVAIKEGLKYMINIEIVDNGVGIDSEEWEVFKPFVTTKKRHKGLGLTIALGLAQRNGAGIRVRNRNRGGTRASLTFPASREG